MNRRIRKKHNDRYMRCLRAVFPPPRSTDSRFVFAHERLGVQVYYDTQSEKLVVLGILPTVIDNAVAFIPGPRLFTTWPKRRGVRPRYTQPVDPTAKLLFLKDWRETPKYSTVEFA